MSTFTLCSAAPCLFCLCDRYFFKLNCFKLIGWFYHDIVFPPIRSVCYRFLHCDYRKFKITLWLQKLHCMWLQKIALWLQKILSWHCFSTNQISCYRFLHCDYRKFKIALWLQKIALWLQKIALLFGINHTGILINQSLQLSNINIFYLYYKR
jgi:hypothetical protein